MAEEGAELQPKQDANDMEPKTINATWPRRILVLASVKLLRHFCRGRGDVLFLTSSMCVKYGSLHHLPEASTMDYVRRNTSIPVPKVYCAFKRKDRTYIVMERLKGEMLAHGWPSRSPESKAKLLQQLKDMIESMRNLRLPSSAVANVDGGRLWDCRLPGTTLDFGPFSSIDAFHEYLRGGYKGRPGFSAVNDKLPQEVKELILLHQRDWGDPVFTHGDLSSLNILVEGDTITGIIDWETAGWYPYYWEYTTACQVNPRNPFWREEVDKFLQPYPEEQRMEELRRVWFGDV